MRRIRAMLIGAAPTAFVVSDACAATGVAVQGAAGAHAPVVCPPDAPRSQR
ncbi:MULTISPECIES: hypothetical protein [Burkholderia]|uniref:Lipoprotein n=1 Tax=Burkholderia paludis TaxID=1506587 RepID=A0A6P2S1B9_9BURK|nr:MULTISPECIES: hypothetical protein [Burkholderia]CAB3773582.1 hypothetical protein LMG30113_07199 [Burkholderia paludis]VWC38378.1 hypothetical protein BPA30113_06726 [Burkholderia paludis]